MTDPHRATPEQWEHVQISAGMKQQIPWATADCLLELRARVEALEADQLEQAENGRFCVDAIVRRVEALEAPMTELRAASAEAQGFAILSWSEERQPCEECRYNHCIAETPFGRFLISWKGWKEHPAVTADETPFGDWFECWNSVEEAKSGCQSEYNRRLALVSLPQLQPELRAASAGARPTEKESLTDGGSLVERVANAMGPQSQAAMDARELPHGAARAAIREVAKWLRELHPSPGMASGALRLEQEADRG